MEDEFWARVEEREQRAADNIEGNTLDVEVQWRNRMDELYACEAAIPQLVYGPRVHQRLGTREYNERRYYTTVQKMGREG